MKNKKKENARTVLVTDVNIQGEIDIHQNIKTLGSSDHL
jgi:hypothetical protein